MVAARIASLMAGHDEPGHGGRGVSSIAAWTSFLRPWILWANWEARSSRPLTARALAGILTRPEDTLAAGKAISDKASQIAAGWQATVNPAMTAVGKIQPTGLKFWVRPSTSRPC